MSHFAVIVATAAEPVPEVLGYQLQPFHEFECTGTDDEFVQDVDETEETIQAYETKTTTRLRDPEGELHEPWDDRFYREPTEAEQEHCRFGGMGSGTGPDGEHISWASKDWGDGKGYRAKIRFIPTGWEEVEVAFKDIQTFTEYVRDYVERPLVPFGEQPNTGDRDKNKYGYALLNEQGEVTKVVDRTNPHRKWDWWVVGGRYSGRFVPKRHLLPKQTVDQIRVIDMDKAAMKHDRVTGRRTWLLGTLNECGLTIEQADDAFHQKREAHEKWMQLTEPKPRGQAYAEWCTQAGYPLAAALFRSFDSPHVPAGQTVEEWVQSAPYLSAMAFVRERTWSEKGEMGGWGMVYNEKGDKDWADELQALIDAVPDDWYLTVVDCHI